MSENENKTRLLSIGVKVKSAREAMGLTQEQFADKYGYSRTTVGKLEAGLRDFKSTEIIKLAGQLNVSCDYLLGRSRAAAPDDFMQEVVTRYGLNEQALQFLERLNKPLDIDGEERLRVGAKQYDLALDPRKNYTLTKEDYQELMGKEDFQTLMEVQQDETNKQALSTLNEILTTSTGREWETFGLQILASIYNYCHREYLEMEQMAHGHAVLTTHTLTEDTQRDIELLALNRIITHLRDKLIQGAKNG